MVQLTNNSFPFRLNSLYLPVPIDPRQLSKSFSLFYVRTPEITQTHLSDALFRWHSHIVLFSPSLSLCFLSLYFALKLEASFSLSMMLPASPSVSLNCYAIFNSPSDNIQMFSSILSLESRLSPYLDAPPFTLSHKTDHITFSYIHRKIHTHR